MSARLGRSPLAIPRDQSGATALEFALVFPLLITLAVVIIQLGWVLHCAASVRWALEGSSRALLMNPKLTDSELQSAMISNLQGVADAKSLSLSITPDTTNKTLLVQSRYTAPIAIPLLSADNLVFENTVTVPNLEQQTEEEAAGA